MGRGTGSDNSLLFGTSLRKIYKSTDRGINWTRINFAGAPGGTGVDVQINDSLNGLAVLILEITLTG